MKSRLLGPERAGAEFGAGNLRGADLWHVAMALYVSPRPDSLSFATLGARQSAVAEALGFTIPWKADAG